MGNKKLKKFKFANTSFLLKGDRTVAFRVDKKADLTCPDCGKKVYDLVGHRKNECPKRESSYHAGSKPIPDTRWVVKKVAKKGFLTLGEVFVSGRLVSDEMDSHRSIKGYESYDIAKRLAANRFPKEGSLIVQRKY